LIRIGRLAVEGKPILPPSEHLLLITGGARSGKSLLAEALASQEKHPVHYIATMDRWPEDKEAAQRIARHRQRRPEGWITHEIPVGLDKAIAGLPAGPALVVIDCLSVYISNLVLGNSMVHTDPYGIEAEISAQVELLLEAIVARRDLNFIAVTNEVGWGVVPENALGRAYRDMLGSANQLFAAGADTVWLSCAGLRLRLKP